jgi:predicted dehydrogenase
VNRRHFLIGGAAAAGPLRPSALASANDTVRVACVGIRGKIIDHVRPYLAMRNVEVAALCDVDESVLDERLAEVERRTKKRPARYVDIRKVLEDKSIDVISIATPNHSHTLQTVWACQAGKDVYIEKPCSHNMFEARQIVAAAKKYGRIVQHGTNQRSEGGVREGVRQLREGLIGEVYMARALCFKWRDTIGRAPVEPVPPGVHYDLWLGPAPKRPFTRNRFHYNFHWIWEYGNGDFGNQGLHQIDVARWGLGVTYPTKISAMGGHFMFDDDQETPNTLTATFEFDAEGKKKLLVADVRHWITNHEAKIGGGEPKKDPNSIGNLFYGSKGYLAVENYGNYSSFLGREQEPGPSLRQSGNHWANFIQAVRSRDQSELNAPIEEGAISTTLVHLGNISYRLGRTLRFDASTYGCVGDEEANRMFTRDYRAPFVVPAKV